MEKAPLAGKYLKTMLLYVWRTEILGVFMQMLVCYIRIDISNVYPYSTKISCIRHNLK